MSEGRKRLLALLGSLFIVCTCCGGFAFWFGSIFSRAVVTEPAEVQKIGAEIVSYTLPDGYSEIVGVDFMQTKTIGVANDDFSSDMIIFLMQVPESPGLSEAETERQLRQMLRRFNMQPLELESDRVETRLINDREAELVYTKGTDPQGQVFKQVSMFFSGRSGKLFLMAQGSEAVWDQAALDQFIDSLR